jgi:phosphotriesterase-related protein
MAAIVRTVRGDIEPAQLGVTLPHEHVIQDHFPIWGDPDETLKDEAEMARELELARASGIHAIGDLSTVDTNHDLDALARISAASGVHIIGSTGWFYGQHLPPFVHQATVAQLAHIMERDVLEGSADGSVRAGVIGEIGWSNSEMLDPERQVFEAAAIVHQRTGVPIFTHTTGGTLAAQQVDFLERRGVDPARIAVSHMDTNPSLDYQLGVARRGAYLSFDRINNPDQLPDETRIDLLVRLLDAGFVRQLLLAHDTARRSQLVVHAGRGYAHVLTKFLPRLRTRGVDDESIRTMIEVNPSAYFAFTPPR